MFQIIDTFPWESLPILSTQPASRIENIHFLYALYKIHEKDIVDGYFMTTAEVGRYIINPGECLCKIYYNYYDNILNIIDKI